MFCSLICVRNGFFLFSRIVIVSSVAHESFGINWNDINFEKSYNSLKAYCQSKLANVLHAKELAKRLEGSGISVYSLHPGKSIFYVMQYCIVKLNH